LRIIQKFRERRSRSISRFSVLYSDSSSSFYLYFPGRVRVIPESRIASHWGRQKVKEIGEGGREERTENREIE
jgi:hypothetical protein